MTQTKRRVRVSIGYVGKERLGGNGAGKDGPISSTAWPTAELWVTSNRSAMRYPIENARKRTQGNEGKGPVRICTQVMFVCACAPAQGCPQ